MPAVSPISSSTAWQIGRLWPHIIEIEWLIEDHGVSEMLDSLREPNLAAHHRIEDDGSKSPGERPIGWPGRQSRFLGVTFY